MRQSGESCPLLLQAKCQQEISTRTAPDGNTASSARVGVLGWFCKKKKMIKNRGSVNSKETWVCSGRFLFGKLARVPQQRLGCFMPLKIPAWLVKIRICFLPPHQIRTLNQNKYWPRFRKNWWRVSALKASTFHPPKKKKHVGKNVHTLYFSCNHHKSVRT